MTEEEKVEFIKNRIAPIFDGMNAKDVLVILDEPYELKREVFSRFTVSLNSQKT